MRRRLLTCRQSASAPAAPPRGRTPLSRSPMAAVRSSGGTPRTAPSISGAMACPIPRVSPKTPFLPTTTWTSSPSICSTARPVSHIHDAEASLGENYQSRKKNWRGEGRRSTPFWPKKIRFVRQSSRMRKFKTRLQKTVQERSIVKRIALPLELPIVVTTGGGGVVPVLPTANTRNSKKLRKQCTQTNRQTETDRQTKKETEGGQ